MREDTGGYQLDQRISLGLYDPAVTSATLVLVLAVFLAFAGFAGMFVGRVSREGTEWRNAAGGVLLLAVAFAVVSLLALGFVLHDVSCSMADQDACPDVGYEDIQFAHQAEAGITDAYSIDFREPVFPESVGTDPNLHPAIRTADWAAVYKTWGDGEWWVACRRLSEDSIICSFLD